MVPLPLERDRGSGSQAWKGGLVVTCLGQVCMFHAKKLLSAAEGCYHRPQASAPSLTVWTLYRPYYNPPMLAVSVSDLRPFYSYRLLRCRVRLTPRLCPVSDIYIREFFFKSNVHWGVHTSAQQASVVQMYAKM